MAFYDATVDRKLAFTHHHMRIIILMAFMVLTPELALADVQWRKFGANGNKDTISFRRVTLTIEEQTNTDSSFPGDDLMITTRIPGHKPSNHYFSSSYGYGSVAVFHNMLFLKYGIGRGTIGARVEHIKVMRLDHDLDEVVDVQCSYYIVTNSHNVGPGEFNYQMNVQTEGDYTTLFFRLPKPQYTLPSEKIVRVKNDG